MSFRSLIGFPGFLTSTPVNMPLLTILSFVCAVFLAVFIPVQRIRTSVPRLSVILWLLGYNLVHAINALVWSGNVGIHIPVWCDIGEFSIPFLQFLSNEQPFHSYKFHVGCQCGLTCGILVRLATARISLVVETHSFSSKSSTKPVDIRHLYVLPISYNLHLIAYVLFLHLYLCNSFFLIFCPTDLVVQDYRFDLVEDLGCSASVDPSAVGISLIWIPPLLICSISTIFFGLLLSRVKLPTRSNSILRLQLFR